MTTNNITTEQYIEHEVQIRVLNAKNDLVSETLKEIKHDLKSQFHWTMSILSVLFVSLFGTLVTALAKSFNWF